MKRLRRMIVVLGFVCVAACGYQLEGGGYINEDITRVSVTVFNNKSSETGAGITFTNALVEEIIRKTDTRVVDDALADFIIEAQINAITFSTLSRSTTDSVTERRVTASVDLKIRDKNNDVVWSVKNFSSNDEYEVSDDTAVDDTNKSEAVEKIAVRSAERLVSKMLSNF